MIFKKRFYFRSWGIMVLQRSLLPW